MDKKLAPHNRRCPCGNVSIELSKGVPRCASCKAIEEQEERCFRRRQKQWGVTKDKYTHTYHTTLAIV